jgi:hypothetical protein
VHRYEGEIGYVWYTQPCAFVSQLVASHATAAMAAWMQDQIDHVLGADAERIGARGGLLVIHDWRSLQGYDTEARRVFFERMRRRPKRYLRAAIVCVPPTPLLRMAVEAANLLAALHLNPPVELALDPAPALVEHGVEAPWPRAFP